MRIAAACLGAAAPHTERKSENKVFEGSSPPNGIQTAIMRITCDWRILTGSSKYRRLRETLKKPTESLTLTHSLSSSLSSFSSSLPFHPHLPPLSSSIPPDLIFPTLPRSILPKLLPPSLLPSLLLQLFSVTVAAAAASAVKAAAQRNNRKGQRGGKYTLSTKASVAVAALLAAALLGQGQWPAPFHSPPLSLLTHLLHPPRCFSVLLSVVSLLSLLRHLPCPLLCCCPYWPLFFSFPLISPAPLISSPDHCCCILVALSSAILSRSGGTVKMREE